MGSAVQFAIYYKETFPFCIDSPISKIFRLYGINLLRKRTVCKPALKHVIFFSWILQSKGLVALDIERRITLVVHTAIQHVANTKFGTVKMRIRFPCFLCPAVAVFPFRKNIQSRPIRKLRLVQHIRM